MSSQLFRPLVDRNGEDNFFDKKMLFFSELDCKIFIFEREDFGRVIKKPMYPRRLNCWLFYNRILFSNFFRK